MDVTGLDMFVDINIGFKAAVAVVGEEAAAVTISLVNISFCCCIFFLIAFWVAVDGFWARFGTSSDATVVVTNNRGFFLLFHRHRFSLPIRI